MSDQTRRDWIVTISQAAVGLELSSRAQAAVQSADQLPPGLYQPSADHLSHALMSTERLHSSPKRTTQVSILFCIGIRKHPPYGGIAAW
jgi:hypothetical protein